MLGSACGSVGRAVASDTRDPQFVSHHWQNFIYQFIYQLYNRKDKIKKKRPGMGHLLKTTACLTNCIFDKSTSDPVFTSAANGSRWVWLWRLDRFFGVKKVLWDQWQQREKILAIFCSVSFRDPFPTYLNFFPDFSFKPVITPAKVNYISILVRCDRAVFDQHGLSFSLTTECSIPFWKN